MYGLIYVWRKCLYTARHQLSVYWVLSKFSLSAIENSKFGQKITNKIPGFRSSIIIFVEKNWLITCIWQNYSKDKCHLFSQMLSYDNLEEVLALLSVICSNVSAVSYPWSNSRNNGFLWASHNRRAPGGSVNYESYGCRSFLCKRYYTHKREEQSTANIMKSY